MARHGPVPLLRPVGAAGPKLRMISYQSEGLGGGIPARVSSDVGGVLPGLQPSILGARNPGLTPLALPTSFGTPFFAPEGQPESSAALQCRVGRKEKSRPVGTLGTWGRPGIRWVSACSPRPYGTEPFFLASQGLEVPGYCPVAPPGQASATPKKVGKEGLSRSVFNPRSAFHACQRRPWPL